jgi:hypothetical protein
MPDIPHIPCTWDIAEELRKKNQWMPPDVFTEQKDHGTLPGTM